MEGRKNMLWYLVTGAMELSWFFAWAMFSAIATMHRPFPFFETIIAFAAAGFLTHVSTGKGWRIVQILGLQVFGFVCAALMIVHRLYYGSFALLDRGWLLALRNGPARCSGMAHPLGERFPYADSVGRRSDSRQKTKGILRYLWSL